MKVILTNCSGATNIIRLILKFLDCFKLASFTFSGWSFVVISIHVKHVE